MFARRVSLNLKPNTKAEFAQQLQKKIIPLLRKQKGFQDEITFVVPSGKEAFGISLWDNKDNAEAYNRGAYLEAAKLLSKVVDGTSPVATYEVPNGTYHKVGEKVGAAAAT